MNEIEIRISGQDDSGPAVRSAEQRLSGLQKVGATAAAGLGAAGAGAGALFASGLAANMNIEVANDRLAGQLGLTEKEAERAGKISGDVYANNFGGSIEEVNTAIQSVSTNIGRLGNVTDEEMQKATEQALVFADTMGTDVALSTEAVGAMMKNGLAKNSTEAFDILTAGMQNGVNKAGDLLETFQEYSPQFSKLGIAGKDALNLLSRGLQAGARDTDVVADAFKELSIRVIDGSALTAQGFEAIGLDVDKTTAAFGRGGESARKATDDVLQGLLKIKDPVERNIAGTALFGEQWNDTVRQILPGLASTEGAIKNVDGATQRMSDTVGDNAAGKIETLKRKFEQWTQSMSDSDSAFGTVVTGVMSFGGGAVALAGNLGMVAVALKGLNVAMLLNPIGLVVLAIAGLAAGLTVLWKKSETARIVMTDAFSGIATAVLTMANIMLNVYRTVTDGVLGMVEATLNALGKIPGNDWADRAAEDVRGFRDATRTFFDGAIGKTEEWRAATAAMPKKIRLQADEQDLQAKLAHSQESLRKLPRDKQTAIRADIAQAQRQIAVVRAGLQGIPDRYVNVYVSEVQRDRATAGRAGRATGGIIGAATGGLRGSWTMVGEQGRELVKLPFGSQVMNNGSTEAMIKNAAGSQWGDLTKALSRSVAGPGGGQASPGGGSTPVVIEFKSDGSRVGDLLLEITRNSVRARGGNVQLVLGS